MLTDRIKVIVIVSICIVAAAIGTVIIRKNTSFDSALASPSPSNTPLDELVVTPSPSASPRFSPTPRPTATPVATSPAPATNPSPIPPTPTPRLSNPPIMDISFPSEMQTVEFTSPDQKLCIVDVPKGGNSESVQRKHSINDASWSNYVDMYTLCFDPAVGTNRFSVQYRNKYGDESQTYTRQFVFKKSF